MEEIIPWSAEEEEEFKKQQTKCLMLEREHLATVQQQAAELLEAHNELNNLEKRKITDERTQRMLNTLDHAIVDGYDLSDLKMVIEKFKQRERIREEQRERGVERERLIAAEG